MFVFFMFFMIFQIFRYSGNLVGIRLIRARSELPGAPKELRKPLLYEFDALDNKERPLEIMYELLGAFGGV